MRSGRGGRLDVDINIDLAIDTRHTTILTFLNTVLVGLAVLLLLLGDTLDAVVVVVLVGSALG